MINKFTPGPWRVKHSESKPAFNIIGTRPGHKYKIARCPYLTSSDGQPIDEYSLNEAEANAVLAAAAPDLLEACKMALWAEQNGESEAQKQGKPRLIQRIEILKAAIQKATASKDHTQPNVSKSSAI